MRRTTFMRVRPLAIVAAAAMTAAGSAGAADLFGGGATFPVQSYVGDNFLTTVPVRARLSRNTVNPVTTTPIATLTPPNTVFARFASGTSNRISFCQTGSGTGKTVLIGVGAVTNAAGECGSYLSGTSPAGFSAPTGSPDYIATDSPITQADVNSFLTGPRAARGLWQIPTLAGAIALPHNASVTAANLSVEQVCRIFSARITNWSGIPGSGSTANINIVYRTDGSGTSFAFTSYLAAACNGKFTIPAGYFKPNQSFAAAVPAVPGQPGSAAPLYAAVTPASGNPGVVTSAIATTASVGYADYPEVDAQSAPFFTVNSASPAALPTSISISAPGSGQVLSPTTNAPVAVTGLTNSACLRLVNPSTIPAGVTYPILAYTYLAGYRSGNGANTTALRDLLGYFLSTQTNRPTPPAGFAYLDGSSTYQSSVQNTITTCVLS